MPESGISARKHTVCCQGDAGSGRDALKGPDAGDESSRHDEHGENILTEEARRKNYGKPQNTSMPRRRSWRGNVLALAVQSFIFIVVH